MEKDTKEGGNKDRKNKQNSKEIISEFARFCLKVRMCPRWGRSIEFTASAHSNAF